MPAERENLFAYTEISAPVGEYVGYLSLNREADGSITLTVRERGDSTKQATIELSPETLEHLAAFAKAYESNAKLLELADRIDHEQNWRQSGIDQRDNLTQDQQDRVLAGVMLRRYADLLGNDGWRIYPPRAGISFRAGTLDKAVEMAKRDEVRRAES